MTIIIIEFDNYVTYPYDIYLHHPNCASVVLSLYVAVVWTKELAVYMKFRHVFSLCVYLHRISSVLYSTIFYKPAC
jgi:hypothetical protein